MASTPPRRGIAGALRSAVGEVLAASRLILALKTALAAAVAWYLAPLVPFADAEYSYYAPLGVLVAMYPTVVDSVRSGLLALLGLACGVALGLGGLAIISAGAPGIVALGLVVGVGVALGGVRELEAGRDWIAIAGLFVLLLGGQNADEFSLSYLATMAFGVVVGIAANYLVLPPLYLREAGDRLSDLRGGVVALLTRIAEMMDAGEIDAAELDRDADALATLVGAVSVDVQDADRSRRGNPRARRAGDASERNSRRWWALERTAFFARDVADLVSRNPELRDGSRGRPELLAEALRRAADAVAAPLGAPEADEQLAAAADAVDRYAATVGDGIGPSAAVASSLGRITAMSRPFA
ncbi:FUSC family protein [Microbacterium invictum]|uniref:FUSC family protein n=1 Tax=Microbacterium invictum TaxID=515415 RepID=A0AA40SPC1_9MICO|nr:MULTISPECIES: FUSC family protein [Microbacterium]MBB4139940.1 hypothetical protein [Microbacterium invictum]